MTMKVLFVATEATPLVKTGGLADVIGSLPQALRKLGIDARVVLPKYGSIPAHHRKKMFWLKSITVPVGWRQQFCGIESLDVDGVPFYFIDSRYYFDRPGLYGFYDEAERFSFYCRAVLESLPYFEYTPDILHCHDWHTGMVSVLLKTLFRTHPFYHSLRTLFTIHNLAYQGIFPKEILGDLLGLGWETFTIDGVEFYDQVSFMKGGLNYSDLISTVSSAYAEEIQHSHCGENLHDLLWKKRLSLTGIVNGIDTELYNPATDTAIFASYDSNRLQNKQKNKECLQQALGLPANPEMPVIAIVSRLVRAKGMDLVVSVLDEIIASNAQMIVLGTGDAWYEQFFRDAAYRYPQQVAAHIGFDNSLAHKVYAGSDMVLMPSLYEPCGITQQIAMRYGTLPVVRETGGLRDTVQPFNVYTGKGNGFSFSHYAAHDMLYTIRWAISLFHSKEIWRKLIANAMATDCSWARSAQSYQVLYEKLVSKECAYVH